MAIYHLHAKIIGRSSGRSSVASAAYRSGEKLYNERDGITHDYTRKSGVVYAEVILPENAPREFQERYTLWNAVEQSEKRRDAQTAREVEIALPKEFDLDEQIKLVQEYAQDNFISRGMCADIAIHDKEDGNPHAHIMLTTREVNDLGFGGKNREWNKTEYLEEWRERWAGICNERLHEKGFNERIDHRTLEAQGIDREPTIHIGVVAKNMERAGRNSERMKKLRELVERAKIIAEDNSIRKPIREILAQSSKGKHTQAESFQDKILRARNEHVHRQAQEPSRERNRDFEREYL